MTPYTYSVHFEGLFIFNLRAFAMTEDKGYLEALAELKKRYPKKHRLCSLKAANKDYIPSYKEPEGVIIKMISQEVQVSYSYEYKKPKIIIEK